MQIFEDRRALHRIPELQLSLPKTMEYLKNALIGLRCTVFSPMDSSLCAWFDFGADHAIAFRADADALPIAEKSGLPFASAHPGQMHACGHDGHMAILLELARRLSAKQALAHNVLLIFQPGEETPGGAKPLCRTGIFETYGVTAVFGLHLWPGLTAGTVFSRENEMMSRVSELTVDIYGESAHIAQKGKGIDASAAMVDLYCRAREMESRLPPEIPRLLNFGKITSGTVRNALSEHARMEGSLRVYQDDVFDTLRDNLEDIARLVEATFGCRVNVHLTEGYPAVINPPSLYRRVMAAAPFAELAEPTMISEDFSFYQTVVPGMFFFLGLGDSPALHADNFNFDEELLLRGADFFETICDRF